MASITRTSAAQPAQARWHLAARLQDLEPDGRKAVHIDGRTLELWRVDGSPGGNRQAYARARLRDGLEQDIPLVLAKSAIALLAAGGEPREALQIALDFGVRNRDMGWGQGLKMLTCFALMMPDLHPEDRPLALYHGLS